MTIPIIDLFAGPGGLGEGFSSFNELGEHPFKVSLSVEKDSVAHQTLKLRSFVRQFNDDVPDEYYKYVKTDKANIRDYLYHSKFTKQHKTAESEAIQLALGPDNLEIENLIIEKVKDNNNWVLIGGPPCQAYSLIGRARMKGQEDFAIDERHTLYENYLQMIAKFKPSIFVMENVKGMLSSRVNGESIFSKIIDDLSNPGKSINKSKKSSLRYNLYSFTIKKDNLIDLKPSDFIVKSEEYGIPQKRHRVILLGIRSDIDNGINENNLLEPKKPVSIADAIDDLPRLRSRLSRKKADGGDNFSSWLENLQKLPKSLSNSKIHSSAIEAAIQYIENNNNYKDGGRFTKIKSKKSSSSIFIKDNWDWFSDESLNGVLNHQSRKHMDSDLQRYLYCSIYAQRLNEAPKLEDFPKALLPNHKNANQGIFSDRFRVQLKNKPATTVTSHISKDGHYYIHYDPTQCRSLSVREAARIQTFPDNYFFEGNVTQQYHQVGNAVPPLLAKQLAATVYQIMKNHNQI